MGSMKKFLFIAVMALAGCGGELPDYDPEKTYEAEMPDPLFYVELGPKEYAVDKPHFDARRSTDQPKGKRLVRILQRRDDWVKIKGDFGGGYGNDKVWVKASSVKPGPEMYGEIRTPRWYAEDSDDLASPAEQPDICWPSSGCYTLATVPMIATVRKHQFSFELPAGTVVWVKYRSNDVSGYMDIETEGRQTGSVHITQLTNFRHAKRWREPSSRGPCKSGLIHWRTLQLCEELD